MGRPRQYVGVRQRIHYWVGVEHLQQYIGVEVAVEVGVERRLQ